MFNDEYIIEDSEYKFLAELYRQDLIDAKDEIRNLNFIIKELQIENKMLSHQLAIAENHILKSK